MADTQVLWLELDSRNERLADSYSFV